MAIDLARAAETLDYYLIRSVAADTPEGIVVEEFVFAGDHTALGLHTAGWTAADRRWWTSADFGRAMRADAAVRARVVAVDRRQAADAYRRLGGGELPGEPTLRVHFGDPLPLAVSAPLRLDPEPVPDGYREVRVYRLLFAGDPAPERLANLSSVATRSAGADEFVCQVRRIGAGVAWCVDLTVRRGSAGSDEDRIAGMVRGLAGQARRYGLILVTIERFR